MRPLPSSLLLAMLRRVSFSGALACVLSLPRILFDLLLAPVLVALSVLVSALLPLQANAQTAPTVDYQFQRALSKIVAGSGSGLVVKQPGTMNIVNAGKVVGSFALNEKRLIDLATLAKYARASTVPAVLALGATELIKYGLEKCADGTWCKSADPYGGNLWRASGYDSPTDVTREATCVKLNGRPYSFIVWQAQWINGSYKCVPYFDAANGGGQAGAISQIPLVRKCSNGTEYVPATQTDERCTPGSTQPTPATDADIETGWKGAFQTNPFIQEKYWGFEDQTQNLKAWEAALAQTAEVINATATEVRPAESTTKPKVGGGTETTTRQTTCTYTATANTDAATQKANPINVAERCVTTTTAPDGTQTQEVTEKAAAPKGGEVRVPEKVDIETCGLPGKPACKIDETGTKAQTDVDAALTQQSAQLDSRLSVVEQAANDSLSSVEQKHGSVHILDFFNIFPTFATEQCENPRVPGVGGGDLPVDVCTYYYMLKDVVSFGVSILVIIDSIQLVREAVKV